MSLLTAAISTVQGLQSTEIAGSVVALKGMTILVDRLPLAVGSLVRLEPRSRNRGESQSGNSAADQLGEIVGFTGDHTILMMLGKSGGISPGDRAIGLHAMKNGLVGESMLGRCIDALGNPIDSLGILHGLSPRPLDPEPIAPLARRRITQAMPTGVRALDLFTTLGQGQRIGVFAGPGVGKSTLLGSIARNTAADVNVISLIGERGREVKDFIEEALGHEGLARSVVVVATGDESPLMRVRAAMLATTIAEYFRDQGKAVMLMMDSVTRFAHAQRQIGLSVGEPPATRGYTPSVFAAMARLLERAGALEHTGDPSAHGVQTTLRGGSITGIYTVLVEGDEMTEPVADAARGILDGHIILSRVLAQRNHYPAVDVLDSISRVADDVVDKAHSAARRQLVRLLAAYRKVEDLVQIGAYAKGSSTESDVAIAYQPKILELLQQGTREKQGFEEAKARLLKLAIDAGASLAGGQGRK
ncbi:MAG: FliI/YscN family ATPase [Pyrinomonadaceae bacterium]|nr:FliI/YscN family ATPase [Phycisphaerales bacterium]